MSTRDGMEATLIASVSHPAGSKYPINEPSNQLKTKLNRLWRQMGSWDTPISNYGHPLEKSTKIICLIDPLITRDLT